VIKHCKSTERAVHSSDLSNQKAKPKPTPKPKSPTHGVAALDGKDQRQRHQRLLAAAEGAQGGGLSATRKGDTDL